jgi:hypothetical protein
MTAPSRALAERLTQARALAEAVLLPLTDSHVNLHPAVPLARALLAALDAEPQRLDWERPARLLVAVREWADENLSTGDELALREFLTRLEADRGK